MNQIHPALSRIARLLERYAPLSAADREALYALPHQLRNATAGTHLVRDGDEPEHCCLLLSGFAFRHKLTGEGARQIISIHIPGEFIDLQNLFLDQADHGVQTLTEVELVCISRSALARLVLTSADIGRALWIETLIDASIFREWVVNVGRRDSKSRVAHLLCEFSLRLQRAGLASNHRYDLPMTQEQLADAVGLTSVHVNRVLMQLERDGLIQRHRRSVTIVDWQGMRRVGDFNEAYLHYGVPPSTASSAAAGAWSRPPAE